MKFVSTRDISKDKTVYTFQEALFQGYAPNDGGLFVPCELPTIPQDVLLSEKWLSMTFVELSKTILRFFIDETEATHAA